MGKWCLAASSQQHTRSCITSHAVFWWNTTQIWHLVTSGFSQNYFIFIIEENTRYKEHCTWDNDVSVPFKAVTFFRKSGLLVAVWIKSLAIAARYSFYSGSRSHGTNFTTIHFMPRSCVKILDTVVFGIPRTASSSHTVGHWSLLIAAHTPSTFSGVLLVAGLLERGSLSTDSQPSSKHLHHTFICAALIALSPKAFWIIWIRRGMF